MVSVRSKYYGFNQFSIVLLIDYRAKEPTFHNSTKLIKFEFFISDFYMCVCVCVCVCVCYILMLCRCSPLMFNAFSLVLVCYPDFVVFHRFTSFEQRYTTVAFI